MSSGNSEGGGTIDRRRTPSMPEGVPDEVDPEEDHDPPKELLNMVRITEVVVMLYALSKTLSSMAAPQFIRYVIGRERGVNDNLTTNFSRCTANLSDPLYIIDNQIQEETSVTSLQLSLAYNLPSVFMSLFLGAYSDQIGRKFLFLLPMFGSFVQSTAYAIISHLKAPLNYMYIAEFVSGMCGGFVTFLIACFAFASDVTDTGKSRSFHITLLECVGALCVGLAMYGLGFMIKYVGFTVPFIIASSLTVVGVVIITFFIKDVNRPRNHAPDFKPKLRQLFYNVFQFYISNRAGTRKIFLLCLAALVFAMLTSMTFMSILTIYLLGRPICMDSVDIGQFAATFNIVSAIGTVIFVKIGQRCLNDVNLATISSVSYLLLLVLLGLSRTKVHAYIAIGAGGISLSTTAMMRVTMSKFVTQNQHGALFASVASVEGIVTTAASTIGNGIYRATVSVFSGSVFIAMACVNLFTIATIVALAIVLKRHSRTERQLLVSTPSCSPEKQP